MKLWALYEKKKEEEREGGGREKEESREKEKDGGRKKMRGRERKKSQEYRSLEVWGQPDLYIEFQVSQGYLLWYGKEKERDEEH